MFPSSSPLLKCPSSDSRNYEFAALFARGHAAFRQLPLREWFFGSTARRFTRNAARKLSHVFEREQLIRSFSINSIDKLVLGFIMEQDAIVILVLRSLLIYFLKFLLFFHFLRPPSSASPQTFSLPRFILSLRLHGPTPIKLPTES